MMNSEKCALTPLFLNLFAPFAIHSSRLVHCLPLKYMLEPLQLFLRSKFGNCSDMKSFLAEFQVALFQLLTLNLCERNYNNDEIYAGLNEAQIGDHQLVPNDFDDSKDNKPFFERSSQYTEFSKLINEDYVILEPLFHRA